MQIAEYSPRRSIVTASAAAPFVPSRVVPTVISSIVVVVDVGVAAAVDDEVVIEDWSEGEGVGADEEQDEDVAAASIEMAVVMVGWCFIVC